MVFSSIPVYLDPPNWHQQQNHHHTLATATSDQNPQLPPLPPPPTLSHVAGPGSSSGPGGSIRPGSMADRARMAKIPQPEAALKCPRCDSTNTKFCYFNNYSLTQPRHFCKTCRRYWTRGGALRSVPVGGGCRRNKKTSKSGSSRSSKSPAGGASSSANSSDHQTGNAASSSVGGGSNSIPAVISPSSGSSGADMIGHFPHHHPSFMASIQNLARFGGGSSHGGLGLNFSEIQGVAGHDHGNLGFQIGSSGEQSGVMLQENQQWRLQQQQFPLLGHDHFEPSSSTANLYPFHHHGSVESSQGGVGMMSSSPRVSQFPPVKLEGRQGLNLSSSRPSLGISDQSNNNGNNSHFWTGNTSSAWTDLSGLNSASSTSHLL